MKSATESSTAVIQMSRVTPSWREILNQRVHDLIGALTYRLTNFCDIPTLPDRDFDVIEKFRIHDPNDWRKIVVLESRRTIKKFIDETIAPIATALIGIAIIVKRSVEHRQQYVLHLGQRLRAKIMKPLGASVAVGYEHVLVPRSLEFDD